jgi:lysyl-tRNA synthetase, class I
LNSGVGFLVRIMDDAVHWADILAENLLKENVKHIVSVEITLFGDITMESIREFVTANAVCRALLDRGEDVDFVCVADNYSPLKKVYPYLSESYAKHVGKPLSEIPCPCGSCANYAEHFLKPALETLRRIGINPTVCRIYEMYRTGRYNEAIKVALSKSDIITKILEEVSGKKIDSEWSPFLPRCDQCGKITKTKVVGFNLETEVVNYTCTCGYTGTAPMAGGGKLAQCVDWPAGCAVLGITVNTFGKGRVSKSSSYNAGKRIVKEVYEYKAPYPVTCERIILGKPGREQAKVLSTTGSDVSASDMLELMPPEAIRYLIIRTKPEKQLHFDPGQSLLALVSEYERLRAQLEKSNSSIKNSSLDILKKRIYKLTRLGGVCHSEIPFKQMAIIYQVSRGDFKEILEILKRSGFSTENEMCTKKLIDNVSRWVEFYAPPFVKFNIKEKVPVQAATLSKLQKAFLSAFAAIIEARGETSAEEYHMLIYSARDNCSELNIRIKEKLNTQAIPQIDPRDLFKSIYISLLGQKSGPRAGWFLSSIEKEFLVKRFEEASTYSPGKL